MDNAWIMVPACVTLNGMVNSVTFLFVQITAPLMENVMLTFQGVRVLLVMEVSVSFG